jgi:hypothetical protein
MENSMETPQKTKNRTNNITPTHIYIKDCKSGYNKDTTCIPLFIAAIFIIAKLWK